MEAILSRLQELHIAQETVSHEAVMTCDAQAEALAGVAGAITKNLFLKDKKGRLYIITALAATKVDLKVLSARLGLGKSGLRMAPDELIPAILGVPLGSVTPLAVAQPSAADVVLLLDAGLQSQPRFFVHPLTNEASTALEPAGLAAFLTSLGREALYVDLQAVPRIDKDNPPDLKHVADAAKPVVGDDAGEEAPCAAAAPPAAAVPTTSSSKAAGKGGKAAPAAAAPPPAPRRHDVNAVTQTVVRLAAAQLAGEGGAEGADADLLRRLTADIAMELNALRNASYSAGYKAARDSVVGQLTGQLA